MTLILKGIYAKYAGACSDCGETFRSGDKIGYSHDPYLTICGPCYAVRQKSMRPSDGGRYYVQTDATT